MDESGNPITDDKYYIETGLIAQKVKEIPELEYCVKYTDTIYEDNDYGDYAVNYNDIFCFNITATQELDRKVIALENEKCDKSYFESRIETLTKENQEQNVKIETLTKENREQNVKIETLTKENREKIETLTKENREQNVKILDLYKENESLKARLAKIESFLGL